jgi:RNA polymerase-binding protein DksA
MAMKPEELESFRQQLWGLRNRLSGDVSQLQSESLRTSGSDASGNLSNAPLHLADLASDYYEQEYTIGLLENQEQMLEEVTEAINRIVRGTFGRCERCQKEIGRERLKAIPYARYCIDCAREAQRDEGVLPGKDRA